MKKFFKRALITVLTVVTLLTFTACDGCNPIWKNNSGGLKPSNVTQVIYNASVEKYSQNKAEASLEQAVNDVYKSVVYIKNTISSTSVGYGCGVVVDVTLEGEDEDVCYVYTCYHVVEDYTSLEVAFVNIPTYTDDDGKVCEDYANIDYDTYVFSTEGQNPTVGFVGGDFYTDVAVLRIDTSKYKTVTENAEGVSVAPLQVVKAPVSEKEYILGQTVFAIGNPTGELQGTVTSGVISYINRDITVDQIGVMKLLQFDAPINSGNSGGGLFNLYGELVGIVNAGATSYENLGFAIPTKISSPTKDYEDKDTGFVNVAEQLITTAWSDDNGNYNYGYVKGRWMLGITVGYDKNNYPYVVSFTADSVFNGKGVSVNHYIRNITFKDGEKTVSVDIVASASKTAADVFDETYQQMKDVLSAGDSVTVSFASSYVGTSYDVTVTLKQLIYRDTGMSPQS